MTKFIFKGPAGEIVLNQEGITLIGNVYVEGPLTEDAGAADGVSPFETTVMIRLHQILIIQQD